MKSKIIKIGECPVCNGDKVKEVTTFSINPYPASMQIMGPGAHGQMEEKITVKIYCQKCKILFKE